MREENIMPRMQPPPGWIRGKEVTARLHISDSLLSRYVEEGKIRRHVPHGRTYGFYNEDDVKILENVSTAFPGIKQRQEHRSFFAIAKRSDIPAIAKIDHDAIHPKDDVYNDEVLLRWQQRSPETLFSLRDINGTVVGFVSILPLTRSALDRVIRGELSLTDIADEDILLFATGTTVHLYIVALAVDPIFPIKVRHGYGAALLHGFFNFMLALADRGVIIETITARSHTQDGIKLMRRLGLPWLISPVPGMELFSVIVTESGMPFLREYSAKLAEVLKKK
jgi:hypothetical protein